MPPMKDKRISAPAIGLILLLFQTQYTVSQSATTVQSGCTLGSEDVSSLLDSEAKIWDLNDSSLETYGLQSIVDCAMTNDTIRMRAEAVIRPETTIRIERSIAIEGISVDSTKITCPLDQALFNVTEVVDVVLRKFAITGCWIPLDRRLKSIIILSGNCLSSDTDPQGSLEVTDVSFQKNTNEGGGVVPHFKNPTCFSLKLKHVEFVSNVISGSAYLAVSNNLVDIAVIRNAVRVQTRHFFFFNLPEQSYNVGKRVVAVNNSMQILSGHRSTLTLLNSEFRFNSLRWGGLLHLLRSNIAMNDAIFESNSCGTAWGCIRIEKGRTADLHSVSFLSNSAGSDFFVISDQRNTNLTSCVFDFNQSFYYESSSIVHFTFDKKHSLIIKDIKTKEFSFYIQSNKNSSVTIESSVFGQNRGSRYGTVYISEAGYVNISNNNFIDNLSSESGGLHVRDCSNVRIDWSSFTRNSGTTGGGLKLSDCTSVRCTNSTFEGNSARVGGGSAVELYAQSDASVNFVNCKFIDNTAQTLGGGVAILDNDRYKDIRVELKDTVFQSNHAQIAGGGIYVQGEVVLMTDCGLKEYSNENMSLLQPARSALDHEKCRWFKGNTVGQTGYGKNAAGTAREYFFFLMKRPSITEGLEEGLVKKTNREYYRLQRKKNWETNIWILAAGRPTAKERNESHRMRFGDTLEIETWRPGDPLPVFEVFCIDRYGQSPAVLSVGGEPYYRPMALQANQSNARTANGGGRIIIQRGTPISSRNAGLIEVLDYSATPGEVFFNVKIEGLFSDTSEVNVTFRECIINEEFPGGNLCKDCLVNAYNFDPTNQATSCSECPENLDCSTRFVFPQKGYWNSFPCSVQAQRCINPDACRYRPNGTRIDLTDRRDCAFSETEIELYWEDQCVEGYKGRLCGECKDGYGSAGAYTCGACRSPALAIALSLIAFAVVFGVSLLQIGLVIELKTAAEALFRVRSLSERDDLGQPEGERSRVLEDGVSSSRRARASSGEDLNAERIKSKIRFSEILKFGINFVQTMTAAASMDVSWTETLEELFRFQRWIGGDPAEAASFSTECLLSGDARTLVRQIVIAAVPLLVVLIQSSYFLKSFASGHIDGGTFLKRYALILIVVFYVCYVSLARTAFALLYCVNITVTSLEDDSDFEKFWALDTSKECFKESHLVVALSVALPILVLTFLFPIFVAASTVVVRSRKKLGSESALDTLGILYRGFNEETVYWDSLILLRKALIVGILTYSYNLGGNLQGLACICVLVIALYLQTVFRPFRVDLGNLNGIESISLLVSILTFLGGVAMDDPRMQSTTAEYILISLIVAGNAGFILFIFHQLLESKWEELKFSLLESGVDIEHKSPMSIFKAWTVLSVSSSVETLTGSFMKMIEMKSRKEAMDEDEGELAAPGA